MLDGQTGRQAEGKDTESGGRESQRETDKETEEDKQFKEQRDAHVHISAQMHTDTDIHIKTHMEAIKQPTSLVPSALCRGRVAQLFPHHRASAVPAQPEPSVDNCSAPYPQLRPYNGLTSPSRNIPTLSARTHK